jgi:alkylated DNA repair dioxygenase AlkB
MKGKVMSAPYVYIPNAIPEGDATRMFSALWTELDWIKHDDAPRREYWANTFDRSYTYGRGAGVRTYAPQPNHPVIDEVRVILMETGEFATFHEGCFLNGYKDERDSLGWHTDDDPGIDHDRSIVSVTLYDGPVVPPNWTKAAKHPNHGNPAARSIQVMPIGGTKADVVDRPLNHGSFLIMKPGMQSTHLHRIPKAGFIARPRISMTFRGLIK